MSGNEERTEGRRQLPMAPCGCSCSNRLQEIMPVRKVNRVRYFGTGLLCLLIWAVAYSALDPLSIRIEQAILSLGWGAAAAGALTFFLYDTAKILLLLVLMVYVISWLRAGLRAEKVRDVLAGKGRGIGYILGAVLGAITPFCSCSSIPLFLGFTSAGVPLGMTLSFLIASPLINEVAVVLLWGLLGWKFTALYVATGDPDTCHGVEIAGVDISVGDDCIAIKSGTIEQAKKYRLPCSDIVIRNCRMRSGHGGVVLGSELSGGIQNVTVEQCLFEGTDRGFRIKTRRGRGRIGITDNIVFNDIVMRNVKVPFVVNMYYNMGDNTGHTEYVYTTEKLPVDDRTPYIGRFTFKDMICTGVEYCAGAFYGLPEAPIGGVAFENVSFSYNKSAEAGFPDMKEINKKVKNEGLYFQFVKDVNLKNVKIIDPDGEAIVAEGVENIKEEI